MYMTVGRAPPARESEREIEMTTNETATSTPIDTELLLARIAELEAKVAAKPTRTASAPREICARDHTPDHWKVTPKGVRYCTSCYKELRLAQAEKKLRELGRI